MRKTIKVDDLSLALDNPRLIDAQNEEEEISNMILDQKDKLIVLASDIVEYGLNPLESVAVYPSVKSSKKYIVAEGNRRICALKLLFNPEFAKGIDKKLYDKFSKLNQQWQPIHEIDVELFDDEDDIQHWIELRHLGEQKGKGLSKWDSVQQSRYQKKNHGENGLIDFWDFLVDKGVLNRKQISEITKTNWQRVLGDKGCEFLKIYKNDEKLIVLETNMDVFTLRMRKMHEKLANQTVAIVYDQERVASFFKEISLELYGTEDYSDQISINSILPHEQVAGTEIEIEIDPEKTNTIEKNETEYPQAEPIVETTRKNSNGFSADLFISCNSIIPKKYSISSYNTRINKIIQELKELNADDFPNACGTLLRALFELSAKTYLENKTGEDQTATEFASALSQAANGLISDNQINKFEHSALTKDSDTLRKLFNGYMHNTDSYPSSEALRNVFKAHKKFIEQCIK